MFVNMTLYWFKSGEGRCRSCLV